MTPLRVVIVDDERLAIARLKALLLPIKEVAVVGTAEGCASALRAIETLKPDLLLLDIKMRDGSAFDLLSTVKLNPAPLVALVTAYPRFASKAFDVDAIDYVLKPASPERLRALVARALQRHASLDAERRIAELHRVVDQLREDTLGADPYQRDFWVRESGNRHVRVIVEDIDWISAAGDYVAMRAGEREHLVRASLDRIEQMLDPAKFIRIHRSTIVRLAAIKLIRSRQQGGKEAVMHSGAALTIGRTYVKGLPLKIK